jgi:hypothetical protein
VAGLHASTEVSAGHVVMKPLEDVTEADGRELVVALVNPGQLSAIGTMTDFSRAGGEPAIAPFGGTCQPIVCGCKGARRAGPSCVIVFFDIAQRRRVPRMTLSFTVPRVPADGGRRRRQLPGAGGTGAGCAALLRTSVAVRPAHGCRPEADTVATKTAVSGDRRGASRPVG